MAPPVVYISPLEMLHASSFFWSGHRDQIAYLLLGGFSHPITAAIQSLDYVLM